MIIFFVNSRKHRRDNYVEKVSDFHLNDLTRDV